MKIRPLYDNILVERTEEEKQSAGGIIIPDSATEKPSRGKITAVGKGKKTSKGDIVSLDVKVGDEVLFGKYAGNEVKLDGVEYLVMKESDIVAVIDK
ncbi:MAG: co-chaperone GroES [Gammaproteobacteria bacterium]|nr:MAG: co-chaperone GroES [Gammaproteobacteria bacterium]